MVTVGYIRLSSHDPSGDAHLTAIKAFAQTHGLGPVHVIEERLDDKKGWTQSQIPNVVFDLEGQGHFIVRTWSHLGAKPRQILEVLSFLLREGINVYVVEAKVAMTYDHEAMGEAFALAGAIERFMGSQRTAQVVAQRRAAGQFWGRPRGPGKSKLDAYRREIQQLLAQGSTQKFIAQRYHTTEANLHRWLKRQGLKKGYCR